MFIRRQAAASLGRLSSALHQQSCRSLYLLIPVRTLLTRSKPNQGLVQFTDMDNFIQYRNTAQQADSQQQHHEQKAVVPCGPWAWTTESGRFEPGFSNGLLVSLEHLHVVHVGLPVLYVASVVCRQHPHVVMRPGHGSNRTVMSLQGGRTCVLHSVTWAWTHFNSRCFLFCSPGSGSDCECENCVSIPSF